MKNLRKQNPQLKYFRQNSAQKPERWWDLDVDTRVQLCAQFILLPVLEKKSSLEPELLEQVMPAAVDLERQASTLLQETPNLFVTIRDLLEKTTALFLLPQDD